MELMEFQFGAGRKALDANKRSLKIINSEKRAAKSATNSSCQLLLTPAASKLDRSVSLNKKFLSFKDKLNQFSHISESNKNHNKSNSSVAMSVSPKKQTQLGAPSSMDLSSRRSSRRKSVARQKNLTVQRYDLVNTKTRSRSQEVSGSYVAVSRCPVNCALSCVYYPWI